MLLILHKMAQCVGEICHAPNVTEVNSKSLLLQHIALILKSLTVYPQKVFSLFLSLYLMVNNHNKVKDIIRNEW